MTESHRVVGKGAPKSLTQRLYDDLRRQISSGQLQPGAVLPSEADLMNKYDVSRNTVREAYRRLQDEGWVVSRQGVMRQVAHPIDLSSLVEVLINRRSELGISRKTMAETLGVSARMIDRLETGKDPRMSLLFVYARALGVRLTLTFDA